MVGPGAVGLVFFLPSLARRATSRWHRIGRVMQPGIPFRRNARGFHDAIIYDPPLVPAAGDGLPELPLPGRALLNGGSEIEFFRYARHGESVVQRSSYADIYERQSKNGPMLFVVTETEYLTQSGALLMRARKTAIRR